jgi:hypothetical protein
MTAESEVASNDERELEKAIKLVKAHCLVSSEGIRELNPRDLGVFNKILEDFNETPSYLKQVIEMADLDHVQKKALYRLTTKLIVDSFVLGLSERVPSDLEKYYAIKRSSEGGRKSADVRNAKAALRYGNEVERLAVEICQSGALSQDNLVGEIQARWKGPLEDLPGHKRLKEQVSTLQKSGKIPRLKRMTRSPLG